MIRRGWLPWLLRVDTEALRLEFRALRLRYFAETDTLHIELRDVEVVETRDLDENTLVDVDDQGRLVAITIEHAKERTELGSFVYERVEA